MGRAARLATLVGAAEVTAAADIQPALGPTAWQLQETTMSRFPCANLSTALSPSARPRAWPCSTTVVTAVQAPRPCTRAMIIRSRASRHQPVGPPSRQRCCEGKTAPADHPSVWRHVRSIRHPTFTVETASALISEPWSYEERDKVKVISCAPLAFKWETSSRRRRRRPHQHPVASEADEMHRQREAGESGRVTGTFKPCCAA